MGRGRGKWLAGAAGASLLLALLLVPGSPLRLGERRGGAAATDSTATNASAPAAYEKYLEGVAALERWDSGENLTTAVNLFEDAVRLDPEFALAYARLSDAHRIQSILEKDPEMAKRALDDAGRAAQLGPELAPVQVALRRAYAQLGDDELAQESLQRALKLDAHNVEALAAMARLYEKLGRFDEAEASFKRATEIQPDSWNAHNSLANFYYRQQKYDQAIAHWRRALEITPDNAAAYTNLGAAFADTGRFAEAQTMYERALAIEPGFTAHMNLGTAFFMGGRYQDAVGEYRKALELNDDSYLTWGNLAAAYAWVPKMGEKATEAFEKASALAEEVATRSPRDPYVNVDLGLYYAHLGRKEESDRRLTAALALAPDDAEIQAWAAEGYEVMGDRDRALELVHRALEEGYSPEKVQRNPQFEKLRGDPRFPGQARRE